jgi:hypothetical protein
LAPHALQLVLKNVGIGPFSISRDASNKGSLKLYPVTIRYFDLERGTTSVILDLYKDSDETTEAIADKLEEIFKALSVAKTVPYGADEC